MESHLFCSNAFLSSCNVLIWSLSTYSVPCECVSLVADSCLSDAQRTQDSLPIRVGGLSLRYVFSLALSAFSPSAANTLDIQDRMLVVFNVEVDTTVGAARDFWTALPDDTDARRPRSWPEPNVARDVKFLWEGATSEMDRRGCWIGF